MPRLSGKSQTKIKSKKGDLRTISPLGEWRGVYTTNEIKKAMELGYEFKFIRALTFLMNKYLQNL